MNQEKLQELKDSFHAQTVIDWFNEELKEMCDISKCKDWQEVLGKQYASKILKQFIRFLEVKNDKGKIGNQYK